MDLQVVDPGHAYLLGGGQILNFLKKEPAHPGSKEMVVVAEGTTNEQVIKVLIDRIETLNDAVPCRENSLALTHLHHALKWLQERTARRIDQAIEGTTAEVGN